MKTVESFSSLGLGSLDSPGGLMSVLYSMNDSQTLCYWFQNTSRKSEHITEQKVFTNSRHSRKKKGYISIPMQSAYAS